MTSDLGNDLYYGWQRSGRWIFVFELGGIGAPEINHPEGSVDCFTIAHHATFEIFFIKLCVSLHLNFVLSCVHTWRIFTTNMHVYVRGTRKKCPLNIF